MQNVILIYQQIWILQIFFQFFVIFSQHFDYFTPIIAIFRPIQLGILANIVSWIMNYQYAKFHVFIKMLTIDVFFALAITVFHVLEAGPPLF